MGLLGGVMKMDVDNEGKASGPFLRGRITINQSKPIKRGVLMGLRKNEEPQWFVAQYERISFRASLVPLFVTLIYNAPH